MTLDLRLVDGAPRVTADRYSLTIAADRPFAYLDDSLGHRLAELFVLSAVQPWEGRDDTVRLGEWQTDASATEVSLTLEVESLAWGRKRYRFRCFAERLTYDIEVEGNGRLTEVTYFGGCYSGAEFWGSGPFVSGQRFTRAFTPEPNTEERVFFAADSGSAIDLTGVMAAGRGDWFFTPPPFCFAFEHATGWLALGVEARPGHNRYSRFAYQAGRGFQLQLDFDGATEVKGAYRLPTIGFDFAADAYAALGAHVAALRVGGMAPDLQRPKPAWWQEPIFCGWGAQVARGVQQKVDAKDLARADVYTEFLADLDAEHLDPGIVTLDWQWQRDCADYEADPAKWPNLTDFIAGQHARGRHVLLWMKAWETTGLPVSECITNRAGVPITCDPTHPAYEARLRAAVRQMLGPAGYDADGFKIDFTAQIAAGPGLMLHGDAWGLELMRRYLEIVYSEAKATKPDALVVTHTPHPYLADVLDMVRLNDVVTSPDINSSMSHRARVARLACPDALIDTDNWPMPDRAAWRAYTTLQPDLGVPALYVVSHLDRSGEALDATDYQLIRDAWARHRRSLQPEIPME